jgi:hypothetical protein
MGKWLAILAVTGAMGCASVQLPGAEIERFDASMRLAKETGAAGPASGQPQTSGGLGLSPIKQHLELADCQAAVAREMAARGDGRAVLLLARAQSDADLALALAREATVHALAIQVNQALGAAVPGGSPSAMASAQTNDPKEQATR